MAVHEIIGLMTAIVVLAGISVAIVNGGNTANIFGAAANGFGSVIKAATAGGK